MNHKVIQFEQAKQILGRLNFFEKLYVNFIRIIAQKFSNADEVLFGAFIQKYSQKAVATGQIDKACEEFRKELERRKEQSVVRSYAVAQPNTTTTAEDDPSYFDNGTIVFNFSSLRTAGYLLKAVSYVEDAYMQTVMKDIIKNIYRI